MLTSLLIFASIAAADSTDRRDHDEAAEDHRSDRRDSDRSAREQGDRRGNHAEARRDHYTTDRSHRRHHVPVYRYPPPRRAVVSVHAPPRHTPPPPPPVAHKRPTHDFVLSVDALDATTGFANVTGEFKIAPRSSFVLEGGLGANSDGARYTAGAELRQYFTGNFDSGLFLGLGADIGNEHLFLPTSNGFSAGPSVGAKFTLPIPVTLQASVGLDAVWTQDYHGVAPTVNLGLGLAF